MYCPRCATQNESGQGYCRKCGQPLRNVQLALDGRLDEIAGKFKKAEDVLGSGLITFAVFLALGLVSFALGGLVPAAFNIVLGVLICLPIVVTGLVRLDRLRRTLDTSEPGELPAASSVAALRPAAKTDPLQSDLIIPVSVTEHTTRRLGSRE